MSKYNTSILLASALSAVMLFVPQAQARDRIQVVGSSTVYPFSTVVSERFGMKTRYKAPIIESTGTGGGFKLFCSGIGKGFPDVSNASRAIKDSEIELCKQNGVNEVVEITIGNDGIVFANSTRGNKFNFTHVELWTAMAAKGPKPKRWKAINPALPDTEIQILTPPPTSGTRDAWNDLVMMGGCAPAVKEANKDDCALMREDGAVVEAGENDTLIVQKLDANADAFGIFGFSFLDSNRDKIQAASIEGVEASLETIQNYDYPVARPLFFYVKKAHVGVIPGIKEFVTEFVSEAALGEDGYLLDVGLVPLAAEKLARTRETAEKMEALKD